MNTLFGKKHHYLAPEQMANVRKKEYTINYDEYKADNFTAGLSIMDCILNNFSYDIFLWNF